MICANQAPNTQEDKHPDLQQQKIQEEFLQFAKDNKNQPKEFWKDLNNLCKLLYINADADNKEEAINELLKEGIDFRTIKEHEKIFTEELIKLFINKAVVPKCIINNVFFKNYATIYKEEYEYLFDADNIDKFTFVYQEITNGKITKLSIDCCENKLVLGVTIENSKSNKSVILEIAQCRKNIPNTENSINTQASKQFYGSIRAMNYLLKQNSPEHLEDKENAMANFINKYLSTTQRRIMSLIAIVLIIFCSWQTIVETNNEPKNQTEEVNKSNIQIDNKHDPENQVNQSIITKDNEPITEPSNKPQNHNESNAKTKNSAEILSTNNPPAVHMEIK